MIFALERVEIADRGAALDTAGRMQRAALVQQCFDEGRLAAPGMSDQADGAYGNRGCNASLPSCSRG